MMVMQTQLYPTEKSDVIIVGGGPVGLTLALGLGVQGFQVRLFEANSPDFESEQKDSDAFDGRVLALSFGSIEFLQQLGIWKTLKPFCTPIEHVHVSQKGFMGITTIDADEVGVNALGYSVQGRDLGRVLWQLVQNQRDIIEVVSPAHLKDFREDENGVCASVEVDGSLSEYQAKLIIGADGTQSQVRKSLGLPMETKSYGAHAILAQIETAEPHHGWSFERFTQNGPVALLPMHHQFHKAVLVCPDNELSAVMALDDNQYLELFTEKMGERMGGFVSVSPRMAYPLQESYVHNFTKGRALLLGNAAHTQHPVAAQGLNLGLRDISVFLNEIKRLELSPKDTLSAMSSEEFLDRYAVLRQPDHQKVMGMTDSLISLFQHKSAVVGHMRGIGLMVLQAMPFAKKRFSRFAMGKSS